jgi:tRNA threonylcarbamoyladenosine biosynthesis protein TsaE
MAYQLILEGVDAQRDFGQTLGKAIIDCFEKEPLLKKQLKIGVLGEVGSGKTTCAQGLAIGLGVDPQAYINSPTFALLQSHIGKTPFHHIDLYRLESASELYGLGLEEIIFEGVSYIEWVQRAPEILGSNYLLIAFEHLWDSDQEGIARQVTMKMICDGQEDEEINDAYQRVFDDFISILRNRFK